MYVFGIALNGAALVVAATAGSTLYAVTFGLVMVYLGIRYVMVSRVVDPIVLESDRFLPSRGVDPIPVDVCNSTALSAVSDGLLSLCRRIRDPFSGWRY